MRTGGGFFPRSPPWPRVSREEVPFSPNPARSRVTAAVPTGTAVFFVPPQPLRLGYLGSPTEKVVDAPNSLPRAMTGIIMKHGAGAVVAAKSARRCGSSSASLDSTVYRADRIESISGGGRIFASRATYDEVKDNIATARHLDIKPKGISHPTAIDELIGITGRYALEKATKPGPGA